MHMRLLLWTGLMVLMSVTNTFAQGHWRALGTLFPSKPSIRHYEPAPTPFDSLSLPKESSGLLLDNPIQLIPRTRFRQSRLSDLNAGLLPTGYIPKFNLGPFTRPYGWPSFWPYYDGGLVVVRSKYYPWVFFYDEYAREVEESRDIPSRAPRPHPVEMPPPKK